MKQLTAMMKSKAFWYIVGTAGVGAASYFGGPAAGAVASKLLESLIGGM